MATEVRLREVTATDLPIFFEQQLDPEANRAAAFTPADPSDRPAFDAKWAKILADPAVTARTILADGRVAGSVGCHPWFGPPEVAFWLGREFRGRGVATRALADFLALVPTRPLHARAAADNLASLRVLAKCGFAAVGRDEQFSNARGCVVEQVVLRLDPPAGAAPATRLDLHHTADLTAGQRAALRDLSEAVHPPAEAAAWPGRAIELAAPEWCVVAWAADGRAECHAGIMVRDAVADERPVRVGGVGGVKTRPAVRGRGLATAAVARAAEFLRDEAGAGFGLLVCEPALVGFYERTGWRVFAGELLVRQRGEAVPFTFNLPMVLPLGAGRLPGRVIDLLGPPW